MHKEPKILLINPPFEKLKGFNIESMSLGLLYIATVLHENGYVARVYDADTSFAKGNLRDDIPGRPRTQQNYVDNLDNPSHVAWKEIEDVVRHYSPDIVGISVKTPVYHSALKTISIVKQIMPHSTIIVGGPHVTITDDAMLQHADVDFALIGEAEYSFLDFVKAFSTNGDMHTVAGLRYRKGNAVIRNKRPDRISSLDSLPFPNKELLIHSEQYRRKLGAIITSRGCPFECAFCATVPLWGREAKYRSAENILKEIDMLYKRYRITDMEILDDIFILNKDNVIQFCKGLIERFGRKKIRWVCLAHLNVLDKELLRYLKKAGCYKINVGIESGSNHILKSIHKNINTQIIKRVSHQIKKSGIQLHGYFMLGIPYERAVDMQQTIQLIKEIKPDSINLCTFTPYPGSELFDYVSNEGLLDSQDVADGYAIYKTICTHSDQNYFLKEVNRETYLKYLHEALTLVGKINKRMTLRKFMMRYGNITFSQVKNKIMKENKKIIEKIKHVLGHPRMEFSG
ncbi:MAG: B12-binding domain-containing radical SAM protein [Candidatus Omnitrophica bacterium]|nr:B12-binding domain-containing radical SAM protein [Candidatus Omnitrophota bacterium]